MYATAQQKGGVGKTTSTVHLGGALSGRGKRVLLVDFDPQGQLTVALGLKLRDDDDPDGPTLPQALLGEYKGYADDLVTNHSPGLDVVRSSLGIAAGKAAVHRSSTQRRLARFLAAFVEDYDYIIIDCPPALGLLTDMAMLAAAVTPGADDASGIIIVTEAQPSIFLGLQLLQGQIAQVNESLELSLNVIGLIINDFDLRNGNAVAASFEKLCNHPLGVLGTRPAPVHDPQRLHAGPTVHRPTPNRRPSAMTPSPPAWKESRLMAQRKTVSTCQVRGGGEFGDGGASPAKTRRRRTPGAT